MKKTDDQIYIEGIVEGCTEHLQLQIDNLKLEVKLLNQEQKLPVDLVSFSFTDEELYIISNALQNEVDSKLMKVEDAQFRYNLCNKINNHISPNES